MQSEQAPRWGWGWDRCPHRSHTRISDKEEFAGLIRKKAKCPCIYFYLLNYLHTLLGGKLKEHSTQKLKQQLY